MGIRGQSPTGGFAPEVLQLVLGQTTLEKGACIDAGGPVSLDVDLVTPPFCVVTPEEVVEADLVQRRRGCVGGYVPPRYPRTTCLLGTP